MSESQVYLVTGASRGLGRSICHILASNGFTVIGLARESTELLSLEGALKVKNSESMICPCDLSSEAHIRSTAGKISEKFTAINGIIHNAGIIGPVGSMFEVDTMNWILMLVLTAMPDPSSISRSLRRST